MKFTILLKSDSIGIDDYWKSKIKEAVKANENQPLRAEVQILNPESNQQRRYLFGSLISLWAFMDSNDYKDPAVLEHYFEHAKVEFSPEIVKIKGKMHVFGKSSKGSKALNSLITKIQDYLCENYGITYSNKALSPDEYKRWADEIAISTTDDFIQFCVKMKYLK